VLHDGARGVLRHRGKSPRQAAFFFKHPEVTFHASQNLETVSDFR